MPHARCRLNADSSCAVDLLLPAGFLGLYRGLSSLLYFSVPKVATRLGGYEVLKNKLQRPDGSMSTVNTLLCGLGAGVAEAIVAVTPMDTIKTRLIHDQLTRPPAERHYQGFAHGVKTIVAEQGIGGIYKGLNATIIKQGALPLRKRAVSRSSRADRFLSLYVIDLLAPIDLWPRMGRNLCDRHRLPHCCCRPSCRCRRCPVTPCTHHCCRLPHCA